MTIDARFGIPEDELVSLTRDIAFSPAYDRRTEGYGQHCVDVTWYVKGPKGVIQFKLFTGWYPDIIPKTLPDDWSDWATLHVRRSPREYESPMPADLGYHARIPKYEGQGAMECSLVPEGECYYGGSGLNANKPFSILVHEGGEKLWEFLEKYYYETFGGGL